MMINTVCTKLLKTHHPGKVRIMCFFLNRDEVLKRGTSLFMPPSSVQENRKRRVEGSILGVRH